MTDATEVIEVQAEIIEPTDALEVTYTQAIIKDNLAAIEAYVDEQLKPYLGAVIDPNDEGQIKEARKAMADLNKLKDPIDDERKRIKRDYEAPMKAFEGRVKGITGKIEDARAAIKEQVDAADQAFRAHRLAVLLEDYEGCAGVIANVIPFDTIINGENEWLRRSTPEHRACSLLEDKISAAVEGYEALKSKQLVHRDECVQCFCQTLDLAAALKLEDKLLESDRKMAEFKRAQEEASKTAEERRETPCYIPISVPRKPEPSHRWLVHQEFVGPKSLALSVGAALKELGITGGTIKDMGVVEGE